MTRERYHLMVWVRECDTSLARSRARRAAREVSPLWVSCAPYVLIPVAIALVVVLFLETLRVVL